MKSLSLEKKELEILKGDKYGIIFMMMYSMGLRYSETKQVKYNDLSMERITIRSSKGSNNKTIKVSNVIKQLVEVLTEREYNRLKETTLHGLNKRLKRLLNRDSGVSTDSLRKTLEMNVYKATKDILQGKNVLGHKSLSSTSYYLENNLEVNIDNMGLSVKNTREIFFNNLDFLCKEKGIDYIYLMSYIGAPVKATVYKKRKALQFRFSDIDKIVKILKIDRSLLFKETLD